MSAKWFICPSRAQVEIEECLNNCKQRCLPLPYLRKVAEQRPYQGITPSMAGNGPRLIYLKTTVDYAIDPQQRAFAVLGTSVHGALSQYDYNVLSEEPLSDEQIEGTPDLLYKDESGKGYILNDWKTWGSFKVAKALGYYWIEESVTDENGATVYYKSGKKKGEIKTKKNLYIDPGRADIEETDLQLNRYRILFEEQGFPVSRMEVCAIVRDGGTISAKSRGIENNIYVIPINFIPNQTVLEYYTNLQYKVNQAFKTGYARKCNLWESWQGRRCKGFCEVAEACEEMSKQFE